MQFLILLLYFHLNNCFGRHKQRIPFLAIIGDKEQESQTVSLRSREGKDLGVMDFTELITILEKSINKLGNEISS